MEGRAADFEGTDLSGVRWAVMVHWPKALHDGNGAAVVYIDESSDEAQREALGKILSGEAGAPVFEILSSIVTTVHGPHDVPIECEFDQEGRTARLAVADHFEAESRPRSAGENGSASGSAVCESRRGAGWGDRGVSRVAGPRRG